MNETTQTLANIRRAMSAALSRRDIAEYKRLATQHRHILHAGRPDIAAVWLRRAAESAP